MCRGGRFFKVTVVFFSIQYTPLIVVVVVVIIIASVP